MHTPVLDHECGYGLICSMHMQSGSGTWNELNSDETVGGELHHILSTAGKLSLSCHVCFETLGPVELHWLDRWHLAFVGLVL